MYIIDKSLTLANNMFPAFYAEIDQPNFHFSFAYRRNKLLGIGLNNMVATNAKVKYFIKRFNVQHHYFHIHSEMALLARLWGRIHIDSSLKLVVLRLNRFLELGDSKPCKTCSAILAALDVTNIWYSTKKGVFKNDN